MPSSPMTLLQMTGVSVQAIDPKCAALVLIDAQQEYLNGRLPLVGIRKAIIEAARLLAAARAGKMPAFHIVQHSPPGRGVFDETGPMVDILPELMPRSGETIVSKRLPNAFAGTDLATLVRACG